MILLHEYEIFICFFDKILIMAMLLFAYPENGTHTSSYPKWLLYPESLGLRDKLFYKGEYTEEESKDYFFIFFPYVG